ncbi:efflux RND transporter periplasmic adaptor subunit [Rhodovulum adriaticum]|uniref:Membrane fusion protein (Multidrug efflux system) n=1 Tax=Rhodovulum adriaticum TaxID=35804 RepID=A0A4V6NQK9_RHOAD|nr:efflux RND transporter periplasmic adaptor subunit [Rhodovulum adriaticum]MBK1636411.1 efflux transporter periplasmic adaptor subunit [Rhodovulum adriaticum]TCP26466.1 membrane fusion protein (multidrug efflux system) [Rhodovulum adriaticum]
MPRPFRVAAALALLSVFLAPPALAQQGGGQDRPPPAVTVVTLSAQDVTLTTTLPGRVVASGVAEVRPQVAGIITERLFEEGAEVDVGDALYQIDPVVYEARVAAARAAVAQAQATLNAARKEADRLQTLLERNVTSQQNLDDAVAARDAAAAGLQVAEAELLAAQIDLDRTVITAPLSGRVGRSLTTRGALVTAGQADPLAVIRNLDPVYVDVTMSAAELIRWRRGHMDAELGEADRTVTLRLPDGGAYEETGQLTAAEPQVDPLTGVVVLRMTFPNPDQLLLPGMYVQVELPQGVAEDVILAPQAAISRDRRGRPTAMVVTAENTVEARVLDVLRDRGSDWIVRGGLADGDRLIVEGLQKIAAGAPVTPQERGAQPQN